jgi:hypothetical protein
MSTPPWGRGDPRNGLPPWMWPVIIDARPQQTVAREVAPRVPVRIGDSERDEAVSALGDHFAAGRLTREELDERIDGAMQARYGTDLEPLFADLPKAEKPAAAPVPNQWPGRRAPSALFLLLPLLMVAAVVTAVAMGAPWVLGGLLWFFVLTRFWGRRWGYPHDHRHHQAGPPTRLR